MSEFAGNLESISGRWTMIYSPLMTENTSLRARPSRRFHIELKVIGEAIETFIMVDSVFMASYCAWLGNCFGILVYSLRISGAFSLR